MLSSQSLHKTRACVLRIAWSFIGTGYGARTRVTVLKGLRPVQLDESGIVRFPSHSQKKATLETEQRTSRLDSGEPEDRVSCVRQENDETG